MAKYIDKATVVAEIDRRIEENKADIQRAIHKHLEEYFEGYEDALVLFKEKFIDTLEIKEVDLEKETKKWWKERLRLNPENQLWMDAHQSLVFAKHFFDLGINARKEDE